MSGLGEFEEPKRRSKTIYFLIDTSEGINDNGEKKLNEFMWEICDTIRICAEENQGIEYYIDVMLYGEKTYWYTASGPEKIEDFVWDASIANGEACSGEAFELLDDRLDLYNKKTNPTPIIFFVSANRTIIDYDRALTILKMNRTFQKAIKIGIPIGVDSDNELLEKFTGTREAIIPVNYLDDVVNRIINPSMINLSIAEAEPLPRLDVFFVVDTSVKMAGAAMEMLNDSLEKFSVSLCDTMLDTDIFFNVLTYGDPLAWVINEASLKQMLKGRKELQAGGVVKGEQAFIMLMERLKAYTVKGRNDYMPVIILINANKIEGEYKSVLEQLWEVGWFKYALKIGVTIGEHADLKMLSMFTGSPEAVISALNLKIFRRLFLPRRVEQYMEDIPGGKREFDIPPAIIAIYLPSGKVVVDENLLAIKKCQIRACKYEEADDVLFSICYKTSGDWESREHLFITNTGKEQLLLKHQLNRHGNSFVHDGGDDEFEYIIESNSQSPVHKRYSVRISKHNNSLVLKNESDDFVDVIEIINPGKTVRMDGNSILLLFDGTTCFEMPCEDDEWW